MKVKRGLDEGQMDGGRVAEGSMPNLVSRIRKRESTKVPGKSRYTGELESE